MAASEADGCAGVGDALGRLVAARALGRRKKDWQAGWAGWLARAKQAEAVCEAYILLFFFYFVYHFISFV